MLFSVDEVAADKGEEMVLILVLKTFLTEDKDY
jgi:hypothetical protein